MIYSLIIKKRLDGLLKWVKNNQNDTAIPDDEKFLYRIFNNTETSDGFNYLDQAISLVTRSDKNPNKIETSLQFNPSRVTIPTIHITLPADNIGKENAIGMGISQDIYINDTDGSYNAAYRRSFTTNYDLMVTSANVNETELVYELLMHLFVAAADTLAEDFDQFTYRGREVMMNNDLVPDRIFSKVISLTVDFKRLVPSIGYYSKFTSDVTFNGLPTYTLTVTTLDGATPIEGIWVKVGKFSTTTNDSGIATFTLMNAVYDYIVRGDGYSEQTGTVEINNEDATLDITL